MAKYKLTSKAVEDLTNIWEYTVQKWSEDQADRYYNLLIENCIEIAKNPVLGKNFEGITPSLFGLKAGRHIIFYRLTNASYIEITRILHEQMDLKNHMK